MLFNNNSLLKIGMNFCNGIVKYLTAFSLFFIFVGLLIAANPTTYG